MRTPRVTLGEFVGILLVVAIVLTVILTITARWNPVTTIRYTQDSRTNVCFAFMTDRAVVFTAVPCAAIPEALLERMP